MRSDKLTKKQSKMLEAINAYINRKGYAPSYRELATIVNLLSASTVKGHLERLKEKGYITWESGQPRTLRVLKTAS
jgi:SOS-response transcriptional repressor LexA